MEFQERCFWCFCSLFCCVCVPLGIILGMNLIDTASSGMTCSPGEGLVYGVPTLYCGNKIKDRNICEQAAKNFESFACTEDSTNIRCHDDSSSSSSSSSSSIYSSNTNYLKVAFTKKTIKYGKDVNEPLYPYGCFARERNGGDTLELVFNTHALSTISCDADNNNGFEGCVCMDTASQQCLLCPPGRYSTGGDNATCLKCPSQRPCTGKNCTSVGAKSIDECHEALPMCAPGEGLRTYDKDDYNERSNYQKWPHGKCETCKTSLYSTGGKGARCENTCPKGFYCRMNSPVAYVCPPGTYNDKTNQISCTSCDVGKFNDLSLQTHSSSCKPCIAGMYTNSTNRVRCIECPKGKFAISNESGKSAAICQSCGPGRFNDWSGQVGNASCKPCAVGQYNNLTMQMSCKKCPKGKFGQKLLEKTDANCTVCEPGKFNNLEGQPHCQNCAPGKYSSLNETTECEPCKNGTFSVSGQVACVGCKRGSYCPGKGMNIIPCNKGTYNDVENASKASACINCSPGTLNNIIGLDQPCSERCTSASIVNTDRSGCRMCPLLTVTDDHINCDSYSPAWVLGVCYVLFSVLCLILISIDPIYRLNDESALRRIKYMRKLLFMAAISMADFASDGFYIGKYEHNYLVPKTVS